MPVILDPDDEALWLDPGSIAPIIGDETRDDTGIASIRSDAMNSASAIRSARARSAAGKIPSSGSATTISA